MWRDEAGRLAGDVIHAAWNGVARFGAIGPRHRRARSFGAFGAGSMIAFPPTVVFGEGRIAIGTGTTIGPLASLSAGMPSQAGMRGEPIITIGDRCTLGKGIGIVGHERIEIGHDIWTGHYVYVTDQNHGYEDIDVTRERLGDVSQYDIPRRLLAVEKGIFHPRVLFVPFSAIQSVNREDLTIYLNVPRDVVVKEHAMLPANA
jgi:hypothetical protein